MKIAICVFLMATTFAVYSQVQDHEFINYDDPDYVTNNLHVKKGLTRDSVIWAFTTFNHANWFPMTWLSHMLDFQIYGENPKGHHLTSLFFHIVNALLLFLILLRMTGALWQSGFVAVLFALHPFNVESVAWVAERKNVLSTFFWLLTLWAYIRYVRKSNLKSYSLVVLFFALGLMSKPMLVTLPFVLLLMDYWPLGRMKRGNKSETTFTEQTANLTAWPLLIKEKIPLFLLTAVSCITTFIVQKLGGALQGMENFSQSARLTNAMVSYMVYLKKAVWPEGLSVLYAHPGNALPLWKGILCAMALMGITIVAIKFIKKTPYFAFGWFWFLGTLAPVIGVVQVGAQAMADRYAYVPLIGIFIIIAWGVPDLLAKWRNRDKALVLLAGIYISVLVVTTSNQVSHWKNSITIFKHVIRVTDKKYPDFDLVYNNLGAALFVEQRTEEAISQYKKAIKLQPNYADAHYNLGIALLSDGKTEEAIAHYKKAIKFKPDYADAHYNLGIALLSDGKNEEAIAHFKKAIELLPGFADAHNNLGLALLGEGKTEDAIYYFKLAIRIDPNFSLAHYNLGNALSGGGKMEEAISHLKMAIKLKPDFADGQNNLGTMYYLGVPPNYKEAVKWFRLSADQQHATAQYNLGLMYGNGQGVPKDFALAHMWWTIAGSNGDKNAVKNRNLVEKAMSPQQIEGAQEMAREWMEKYK
ncbi:MAG: tetratricopeptide repeat protein [Nitrospina sp.]|nr:tetratricopeptide repeat protein [Nitrospina sp.]MBT5633890.1 tetratricopeptide repeat protein [Nitrospina sp.]